LKLLVGMEGQHTGTPNLTQCNYIGLIFLGKKAKRKHQQLVWHGNREENPVRTTQISFQISCACRRGQFSEVFAMISCWVLPASQIKLFLLKWVGLM